MDTLKSISAAVIAGQAEEIKRLTDEALGTGVPAQSILDDALMHGMDWVGVQFKNGDMFIPEVMASARAMQASMDLLKPHFAAGQGRRAGRVILGTVKGDLHDLGKNLVAAMLEAAGFEVHDLGIDVPTERFVAAVKEQMPDILGLSALLTTTMGTMRGIIKGLQQAGVRGQVKVIVGGAPISAEFAKEIGADGYGPDAMAAVDVAKGLMTQ